MVEQVDWNDLEQKEKLGFGSFSDVYKAFWTKNGSREQIVVKVFRDKTAKYNAREIKYLSEISHENIVAFYGITKNLESNTAILLEYADCGSLHDYLHKPKDIDGHLYSYEYLDSLRWMHQLAKAINYLHKKNIIHRDLKPHNLLLFDEYKTLKIADFGTVTEMKTKSTEEIGTAAYMAPEVIRGGKPKLDSDVYSYGIIFWEVVARKKPFSHLSTQNEHVMKYAAANGGRPKLEELSFDEGVQNERFQIVKQLFEACWNEEFDRRPTMEKVLSCFFVDEENNLKLSPLYGMFEIEKFKRDAKDKDDNNDFQTELMEIAEAGVNKVTNKIKKNAMNFFKDLKEELLDDSDDSD